MLDQIRAATNGNFVLGDNRFAAEIEQALGRRAKRGAPGRPRQGMPDAVDQLELL